MLVTLTALVLNCTLTPSPGPSSTDKLAVEVAEALSAHDVAGTVVRVVDHDLRPGVEADLGDGDAWPGIREQMLACDILVLATPTWLGQHSSVAQRVLERLDAELSETDDEGRPLTYGKVAGVAIVGNEDGAHHISAVVYQALSDVGFTIPAQAVTYWNGGAMQTTDYRDLDTPDENTQGTTATLAAHLAHLARLLRDHPYPPPS
ncbi:MAG: flavodoxin family protein [Phycicoccus sp.]